jgi:hypothetical protein
MSGQYATFSQGSSRDSYVKRDPLVTASTAFGDGLSGDNIATAEAILLDEENANLLDRSDSTSLSLTSCFSRILSPPRRLSKLGKFVVVIAVVLLVIILLMLIFE